MVRRGLIVTFVCLLVPGAAFAQRTTTNFTGFATVLIGGTHGGDAADTGWTPGASVAVIEANGWGAEIDLGHAREFDSSRFEESGITTLMFNATGVWSNPTALVRPYLVVGAGLIRVRACPVECVDGTNRTDAGFDAGAGAFVIFNEIIGARFDMRYFRYLQRHDDLPLTDNGFFDFWRTSIGITFQWPVR